MARKQLNGKVISNKMTKAIIVSVEQVKMHPKYKKRFTTHKKYAVRVSDSSKYAIGDIVTITECRPVSKTISFEVIET